MELRKPYKVLVELVCSKIENKLLKGEAEGAGTPVKMLLLGGYALDAIGDSYELGIKVLRKTDDIDFYTPDAKILGDRIGPTGATMDLTDDLHGEMFDWISGMDHDEKLEDKIAKGLDGDFKTIRTNDKVIVYVPDPAVFVVNKLSSYRQDNSRKKDLGDVAILYKALQEKGRTELAEAVDKEVESYGLKKEFNAAKNWGSS